MNKINFENLPSTNTPINASNLNQIQTNVENEFANRYDLTRGTAISNNSDLNDYTTIGSYYCNSSASAQTFTNCPITSSFKLVVENTIQSTQFRQTIKGQGQYSQTWIRTYNGSNWGDWKKVLYTNHNKTQATLISNYFDSTEVTNNVVRDGNVVHVQLRGKVINAIPNNTNFLNLPYHSILGSNESGLLGGIGGQYNISNTTWFYLHNGTYMRCGGISVNQYVHLNFTYITDDE